MFRLGIVVPYRDRIDHLAKFVPHLSRYLDENRQLPRVSADIIIAEQNDSKLFNKGALLNAAFLIAKESFDYVCFHDVDYLPIAADYSLPHMPARRIWRGAESRPLQPGGVPIIHHRFEHLFGGVLIFRKEHFYQVNGFSNFYQGWGFEDADLRERCRYEGLGPEFGQGHFEALDHVNRGLNADLSFNHEALRNRARYQQRWVSPVREPDHQADGLSTAAFDWSETRALLDDVFGAERYPRARHLLIDLQEPIRP